jgi:hypothetical protein
MEICALKLCIPWLKVYALEWYRRYRKPERCECDRASVYSLVPWEDDLPHVLYRATRPLLQRPLTLHS